MAQVTLDSWKEAATVSMVVAQPFLYCGVQMNPGDKFVVKSQLDAQRADQLFRQRTLRLADATAALAPKEPARETPAAGGGKAAYQPSMKPLRPRR